MDRIKIKEEAKKKIKGNLWYLWKPHVYVFLLCFAILFVIGICLRIANVEKATTDTVMSVVSSILGMFEVVFSVAYAKYTLEFIRGKKMEFNDVIGYCKEHFVQYFVVTLLVGIITTLFTFLLIIPGIIAGIGLMFYQEVCADNENMSSTEVVKKSWAITKGHKVELFVLGLSFIGWFLLGSLTFGILYIWIIPYMIVTLQLAYEELRKAA